MGWGCTKVGENFDRTAPGVGSVLNLLNFPTVDPLCWHPTQKILVGVRGKVPSFVGQEVTFNRLAVNLTDINGGSECDFVGGR